MSIHWTNLDVSGKVEAIKAVYVPGMSSADISDALGVSRKSVLGVYDRRRDALKACPLLPIGSNNARKRSAVISEDFSISQIRCEGIAPPRNIELMDLERNDCRWPVSGSGAHTLFCANPKKPGDVSYCPGHRRLSCGPGTESERVAHKVLKQAA